jgi:SAM-dependent methyltransferase
MSAVTPPDLASGERKITMEGRQITYTEQELRSRFSVKATSSPGVFDYLDEEEILASCNAWIDGGDPRDPRNWRYFAVAGFLSVIGHDRPCVLDVGCGIGWPTFAMAPFCSEITGLDYSEKMIQIANQLLKDKFRYDNVGFVCADMGAFALSSSRFDVITSDNSLDLGTQPLKQIQNLGKLLKPGGCLAADFNNIHDILAGNMLLEESSFFKDHFTYSVWDGHTYERRGYHCCHDGAIPGKRENRKGPPSSDELDVTTEVYHYIETHFDAVSLRCLLLDADFSEIDFYSRPKGWVPAISEFEEYGLLEALAPKRYETLASLFAFAQPTEDPRAHFVLARRA